MSSSKLAVISPFFAHKLWYRPTITIARFTLRSHIRSGWILGDIVFVWFLYALFFLEFGGNVAYFYGTAIEGLGVLAVVDAIVMTKRAMNARAYLSLARLTSRSAYVRGIMLASGVLRVLLFLLLLLLALGFHRIEGATLSNILPGAVGLLLICMILSSLTILLSKPIATRRIQIVFLIWIAAVMYSNNNSSLVAQYLKPTSIPLAPLAACYDFGHIGVINAYGLAMLLLAIGYMVGILLLADNLFKRRDLILH